MIVSHGAVVWITGLPASGKSSLADRVRERCRLPCVVLDSDQLRDALDDNDYQPAGRRRFYQRVGELAALLARQGLIVVVAATASRRAYREDARTRAPRFVEVWVDTPLATCIARDPKGLYAAARSGRTTTLPGLGEPYEVPPAPDVIAHGGHDDRAVEVILGLVSGASPSARHTAGTPARAPRARSRARGSL